MKQIKWAALITALGLIGYAAWIAANDIEQITSALVRVGWQGFVALCCVSLINYVMRYMRWRLFMRVQQQSFPFFDGLVCYLSGFALITTPGKFGELVRAIFFKERHQVPVTSSLANLLGERVTDLLIALLIGFFGFIFFKNLWWVLGVALSICCAVVFLVFNSHLIERFMLYALPKIPKLLASWLEPLLAALPNFFEKMRLIFTPKIFLLAMLMGGVAWYVECLGFAWLAHQLDVEANVLLLCSVFALSLIAGVVTPGGIGSAEAAMAFFLIALGATPAIALVIALVCRFATFWLALSLGLLAMLYLMRGNTVNNIMLEASDG